MTLREMLGVELPVLQAPMAGVQDHALAAAVCEAGGLGALPCALLAPEAMRAELTALRARTDRPFNVNVFCHAPPEPDAARDAAWRAALAPYYVAFGFDPAWGAAGAGRQPFTHAMADIIEPFRPPVMSFHFGLPDADLLARVHGWGTRVLASATSVEEGRWLEARGVDAVIAQGHEAGGHRGHFLSDTLDGALGTFALVPQLVRALRVPVIAAGGVADARGVEAALALGASAVQVGTAYLLCPEATTGALHRAALQGEEARHTAYTNLFTGRPARGIVNRLMRELGPMSPLAPAFPLAAAAIAPLRIEAERRGRGDFSPLWAGQNVTGCKSIPAARLTRELAGKPSQGRRAWRC
ncbi:MAG: nitronate monooxygenase [Lysobacter sp.]|nr:nitronate monooxygenase [Lysobacter sp.]